MANKISVHKCLDCGEEHSSQVCLSCGSDNMVQYKVECPACKKAENVSIAVWGDNLIRVKKYPHMGRCKRCQYRNHFRHRRGLT
jgi:hypothetical protein